MRLPIPVVVHHWPSEVLLVPVERAVLLDPNIGVVRVLHPDGVATVGQVAKAVSVNDEPVALDNPGAMQVTPLANVATP